MLKDVATTHWQAREKHWGRMIGFSSLMFSVWLTCDVWLHLQTRFCVDSCNDPKHFICHIWAALWQLLVKRIYFYDQTSFHILLSVHKESYSFAFVAGFMIDVITQSNLHWYRANVKSTQPRRYYKCASRIYSCVSEFDFKINQTEVYF